MGEPLTCQEISYAALLKYSSPEIDNHSKSLGRKYAVF
jgi:hypothetical protein